MRCLGMRMCAKEVGDMVLLLPPHGRHQFEFNRAQVGRSVHSFLEILPTSLPVGT